MALPEVGVKAVVENLNQFTSATKTMGKSVEDVGLKFDEVAQRWRRATGQFATDAEVAAAGLRKPKTAADDTGKSFINLSGVTTKLGGDFVGLGSNLLKVGVIAGGAALAGVTALMGGLIAIGTTGVNKAKDLDQQMANIASTMGVTKAAVGPLKDEILDLALDPNLTVTATQAADAIEKLGQNGLTTQQILDGAARSTVAMANATGADFTTAANIATGAMQNFNLKASDLEQVADGITGVLVGTKFSAEDYSGALAQAGGVVGGLGVTLQDFNTVLAASASSFASGSDAGTSFKTFLQRLSNPTDEARAAMDEYGISLFDATGKMRPLSEVAQQLNDVFNGQATVTTTAGGATKEMTRAAEQAQKAIPNLTTKIQEQQARLKLLNDEQGAINFHYGEGSLRAQKHQLSINELTNSIAQNQAKMSGYEQAISAVNDAHATQVQTTKTLTEAEKAELATIIGGADASRTVLALSKLTEEQFKSLSGTVNNSGQAFKAAATRVDSLQGAFDIFGGIIEAIQIQVGDLFLPVLRQVTSWFTDTATRVGPMVVAFFGQIAQGIQGLIAFGSMLVERFQQFGPGGLLAGLGLEGGALLFKKLSELFTLIMGDATNLSTTLTTTLGAALSWLATNLLPMITQGIQFVIDHFNEFKGAIMGVGVVLGGAIFAALAAALFSLLTPINLIIAGAALLGAAWAGNWGGIQEKTFAVWAIVQPILAQLGQWLSTNIPIAIQALTDAWDNVLFPSISAVWEFVSGTMFPLWLELQTWLATTLVEALTMLSDQWTNYLLPAVTTVWAFFDTKLMPLWASVVDFMKAVFGKAVEALAGLWENILLPALRKVWDFISQNIMPIFNEIWSAIKEKLQPAISDLTGEAFPPFQEGLENIKKIIQDVTGFFQGLTNAVKSFELPEVLQRHSPSPFEQTLAGIAELANEAGLSLAQMGKAIRIDPKALDRLLGVTRGIASTSNIIGSAADNVEKFFDKAHLEGSKTKFALRVMKDVFKQNSAKILGAGDKKAQVALFEKIAGGFVNFEKAGFSGDPGKILKGGFGVFIDQFNKMKIELQKEQQQIFIEAGRTALTIGQKLNDIISGSADILNTRVDTLKDLVASGLATVNFEGQTISQLKAQELLNQALGEQVAIQDELLALKQNEAKLGFLEKQLNLIETINDAGLDVNAILGGLKLGINASIPDLIAATSNLVTAMIDQVDQDLQIASPSKVMQRKGLFTGQGFAEGIMGSLNGVMAATRAALSGPALVSGPALGAGGGNIYNFNNDFGGNNISSGMDEAQFNTRVLRAIQTLMR